MTHPFVSVQNHCGCIWLLMSTLAVDKLLPYAASRPTPPVMEDRQMRTTTCVVGALAALALTLTACSSDGGGDTPATADTDAPGGETTEISMGVLPIVPSAALQLGIDEGIFAEHGFDVTLEAGQGGAALLPAVVSGQIEFAISNPLSIMLARGEGLDVRMVTGYSHALPDGVDINSIMAMSDSGISGPADLEGKTVAVNTLRTMGRSEEHTSELQS